MWESPVNPPGLGPGDRRFEACHPDARVGSLLVLDDVVKGRSIKTNDMVIVAGNLVSEQVVTLYSRKGPCEFESRLSPQVLSADSLTGEVLTPRTHPMWGV